MDAPLSNSDLNGFLELAKSFGSVGWAIVAWFAFKAKDALVTLCKAGSTYLESIAKSNETVATITATMSHDIKNMRAELIAISERVERHEREFHGTAGPRFVRRSSPLRREPDVGAEPEDVG